MTPAVSPETLRKRLSRGWTRERALLEPAKPRAGKSLEIRLERRTLRDLACSQVTSIYAARIALWADWRGPVSHSPLIASLGLQIAPAEQAVRCDRPPIGVIA